MTYQERFDMFAAAALTGLLAHSQTTVRDHIWNRDFAFHVAQLMIKESDRICAEKK